MIEALIASKKGSFMWKWVSSPASPKFARLLGAQTNGEVLLKGGGPVAVNIAAAFIAWLSWVALLLLAAVMCWLAWTAHEKSNLVDTTGRRLPGRPLYPRGRWACLAAFVLLTTTGLSAATWRIMRGDHPVLASIKSDVEITRSTAERVEAKLDALAEVLLAAAPEDTTGSEIEAGELKQDLTAALERAADAEAGGDADAKAALEAVRNENDPAKLIAFLTEKIKQNPIDPIELHRERAAVAHVSGEIKIAEASLRAILALSPDDLHAINRLGHIQLLHGELDEAETSYHRVLELSDNDESGQAAAYGNLGLVIRTRGDLDGAEAMFRKALAISEKLGSLEGMATQYGNLGLIMRRQGDLEGAESMLRKSLGIEEKLGRLEGMANDYGNLGLIMEDRGDLDGAEAMYRKSLAIDEKLGRLEGIAAAYGNLGVILQHRGDLDGAEAMHRKALAINEKLGRLEGMAIQSANLGSIQKQRGIIEGENGARTLWTKSRHLFAKLGAKHEVAKVQGFLDSLPKPE